MLIPIHMHFLKEIQLATHQMWGWCGNRSVQALLTSNRAFADPLSIQTVFEVRMRQTPVPNLSQLFCPRYRIETIHWMTFCVLCPGILLRERKKNFSTRQHLSLALWIPRIPVESEKHQGFQIYPALSVVTFFLLEIFNIGRG